MTASQKFEIISALRELIPVLLTLAVMYFSPVPRRPGLRAVASILIGWVALVFYTNFLYNPSGIAAGRETGAHFPEASFDNNTVAAALLGGWLFPSVVIGIYFLGRRSVHAQQGTQDRRVEDNARLS